MNTTQGFAATVAFRRFIDPVRASCGLAQESGDARLQNKNRRLRRQLEQRTAELAVITRMSLPSAVCGSLISRPRSSTDATPAHQAG